MTSQSSIPKSLVEQILDEMFANVEPRKEFDKDTIDKLKHLAASGGLDKVARVTEVIKSAPGTPP
jgi:predicted PP-loop superfamily ATPase